MQDFDFTSFVTFALFMLLPAVVFVMIFIILRARRGKFKRQRITSRSGRHREADKNT